jgi:hypothetical protein
LGGGGPRPARSESWIGGQCVLEVIVQRWPPILRSDKRMRLATRQGRWKCRPGVMCGETEFRLDACGNGQWCGSTQHRVGERDEDFRTSAFGIPRPRPAHRAQHMWLVVDGGNGSTPMRQHRTNKRNGGAAGDFRLSAVGIRRPDATTLAMRLEADPRPGGRQQPPGREPPCVRAWGLGQWRGNAWQSKCRWQQRQPKAVEPGKQRHSQRRLANPRSAEHSPTGAGWQLCGPRIEL